MLTPETVHYERAEAVMAGSLRHCGQADGFANRLVRPARKAVLPVILTGQLIAAVVGGVAILPLGRRLWKQGIHRGTVEVLEAPPLREAVLRLGHRWRSTGEPLACSWCLPVVRLA